MADKNKNRDESPGEPDPSDVGAANSAAADSSAAAEGQPAESADAADETVDASIDDEQSGEPATDAETESSDNELSEEDQRLLDDASRDLVSDMRDQMLRAQAELVNFRTRVERDRVANREAVIADVVRSMLPALDDLDRADKHGDLIEGTPLALVSQKIKSSFERFGMRKIGEKGERFDPAFHEAVVHLNDPEATENTIADVIEPGYILGERVVRAAKVAVSGPTD
ncbi:nucleotide exchange factor GrpE [Salinibacterium sp. M195]|uniref:nucleotide exchange factor GrpE n=1 Tax=Salinibacterium sp. M195 TaxID=2583374 RepID=UPI0021064EA1|nr:nucleotide exchange factor GrpE [Salinibacterium sp. M195]